MTHCHVALACARVAAREGCEVTYIAQKHGITAEQARDLIAKIGNDRAEARRRGEKLTSGSWFVAPWLAVPGP